MQISFSADELFLRMRSKVSRATVYNTLDKLVECNLLTMRNFGDKLKRYEATAAKESHDH
jgi:Fur family ferric uptake transcriptional regulator